MSRESMTYRPLGRCGMKVSLFGLGGWTTYGDGVTDNRLIRNILSTAFDAGVTFFDIADAYGRGQAELVMGKVLHDFPRHELVISSKLFWPMSDDVNDRGLSRKHIMESVEKSLKRIGTDYLDIYFCHRYDPEPPLEETLCAMDDLVHQGKVLYWGTSEWTADQLAEACSLCDARNLYRPQVEQPQYSLLHRNIELDVRKTASKNGLGLVAWSPLASGVLTGKYDDGIPKGTRLDRIDWLRERFSEDAFGKARAFKAHADALGCTRAQLALAWVAAQPGISSVITGATCVEQLTENLQTLQVSIPDDVMNALDNLFPA